MLLKTYKLFVLFIITMASGVHAQEKLVPIKIIKSQCNEPSDILFFNNQFYVLGDKAFLYQMNLSGTIESTHLSDFDLEGMTTDGQYIYVSEETYQRIWVWDPQSGQVIKQIPFKHGGGRNEGVESLAFDAKAHQFILATEKDPNLFYRTDLDFNILEQFKVEGISEVSGMTYHKGLWYVLSDEESTLYQVNDQTKKIEKYWELPIINAEGVAFDNDGGLWISADDMKKIFQFKSPIP